MVLEGILVDRDQNIEVEVNSKVSEIRDVVYSSMVELVDTQPDPEIPGIGTIGKPTVKINDSFVQVVFIDPVYGEGKLEQIVTLSTFDMLHSVPVVRGIWNIEVTV